MSGFKPFEIIPGDPSRSLVILGDHAMNRLPPDYGDLGLPPEAFQRHIAYDIGVEDVTRGLCASLGIPAVLGCFSRLLIDPNRGEDDPTLIMKLSDGMVIPANHPLSAEERRAPSEPIPPSLSRRRGKCDCRDLAHVRQATAGDFPAFVYPRMERRRTALALQVSCGTPIRARRSS